MTPQQMERAGEYVLDLLDAPAREAFEASMAADPVLSEGVARLQRHLQSLDDSAVPVAPSAGLWSTIERQLDTPEATPAKVIPLRATSLARGYNWRAMAASVVVALGLGYVAGSYAPQTQPVMIAVLIDEGTMQPGAIVEAFADDSIRLQPLELFNVPEGKILQVWTLPDVATGPVSLGTFSDTRTIRLTGPNLPQPNSGQLYEITLEPSPGSPTGKPTGPILVKGFAKAPLA